MNAAFSFCVLFLLLPLMMQEGSSKKGSRVRISKVGWFESYEAANVQGLWAMPGKVQWWGELWQKVRVTQWILLSFHKGSAGVTWTLISNIVFFCLSQGKPVCIEQLGFHPWHLFRGKEEILGTYLGKKISSIAPVSSVISALLSILSFPLVRVCLVIAMGGPQPWPGPWLWGSNQETLWQKQCDPRGSWGALKGQAGLAEGSYSL